jgi:hypothetical protein
MKSLTAWPTDLESVSLQGLEPADVPIPPVARAQRAPLAVVALGTSGGLLVQSFGYALGRAGHEGLALALFFLGLVAIFAVSAWRLLDVQATRGERIAVSVTLVLGLTASIFMVSPLLFDGYDDLLHQASLWQWGAHRGALAHNSLLPVSPDYPGLEALTLGFRWTTGLPLVVCEMATVLLSRIILVLVVFFVVERLTTSSRAAGAGVVLYAASPQFYAFNASFSYQTLALALGAGCIYLLLRVVDHERQPIPEWSLRGWLWLSIACCVATVVTHHLVGWLTVGLLVVWFVALAISRRSAGARAVGTVAGVGLLAALVWTAVHWALLAHYLGPILSEPVDAVVGLAEGNRRSLFQGAGTFTTPRWEQAVMLGAAVAIVALIVVAIRAVLSDKTSLRGGRLRWIPIVIALGYLLVLGSRLAAGSEELGGRLSTFVFFGIAIVGGAWYATVSRTLWKPAVVGVAVLCCLGGMLLGSGPDWLDVPGPFVAPSADQRSIDAASVAAARWAATNLPANSVIAADRDNSALMAALGHLDPESEASGGSNVGPLYFARTWGAADTALVRRAHIRYLLVDQRLDTGPPAFGTYFEPGETTGRDLLTHGELAKFAYVWGMQRIYDNGPIQIYDLAQLLGLSRGQQHVGSPQSWPNGPDWVLLAAAAVVLVIWARRWRFASAEGLLLRLLAATLTLMACAVVIFFLPLPATFVGLVLLCILAAVGLRARSRRALPPHPPQATREGNGNLANTPRRMGRIGRYAIVVLATSAVVGGAAASIAVASEATAWRPPTSLTFIDQASGRTTVDVHLADDSTPAQLVLWEDGHAVSHWRMPSGHASWSLELPPSAPRPIVGRTRTKTILLEIVELRQNGRIIREVSAWAQHGRR